MKEDSKKNKGGRPKGSMSEANKLALEAKRRFNIRASKLASKLLSSQALIATGTHTLMKIEEHVVYRDNGAVDDDGNSIKTKHIERKFVVVRDPEELEMVYNDFGDIDGSGVVDGQYYFVTHDKPNNMAIDSILNRIFGRAKETMELITSDGDVNEEVKQQIDSAISEYFMGKKALQVPKKTESSKADALNFTKYG